MGVVQDQPYQRLNTGQVDAPGTMGTAVMDGILDPGLYLGIRSLSLQRTTVQSR